MGSVVGVGGVRAPPYVFSWQVYVLRLLVMLLPAPNRACLRMLLNFLCRIAERQAVNKMGIANLAVVFAPTLFYVRGLKGEQMLKEIELQVSSAATLTVMMENARELWSVSQQSCLVSLHDASRHCRVVPLTAGAPGHCGAGALCDGAARQRAQGEPAQGHEALAVRQEDCRQARGGREQPHALGAGRDGAGHGVGAEGRRRH